MRSISTKRGDDGLTDLMFGERTPKNSPRIRLIGSLDEMNSRLGVAKAFLHASSGTNDRAPMIEVIDAIQNDLYLVMGELSATDTERYKTKYPVLEESAVDRLTTLVGQYEPQAKVTKAGWATPGNTLAGASLDLARTGCRTVEREMVDFSASATVRPVLIRYLNRLSDLCWAMARHYEKDQA